jgi:hypothetical protein
MTPMKMDSSRRRRSSRTPASWEETGAAGSPGAIWMVGFSLMVGSIAGNFGLGWRGFVQRRQ